MLVCVLIGCVSCGLVFVDFVVDCGWVRVALELYLGFFVWFGEMGD